ncbi:MAG: phosphoserine phosphatase SerB [Psychrobacter sp.]|nr:phosphoserine phosphatase SerB [Psychrobacter sp.]
MPKNTSYSLPKDSKAWQQALDSVASLLPSHIDNQALANLASSDQNVSHQLLDALQSLPIFALIVVLPKHSLLGSIQVDSDASSLESQVDYYIQSWVDEQPNWQLARVTDDANAERLEIPLTADISTPAVSEVSVQRYLLIPTTDTLMSPEKKTAAAHIIDDQLTSRLRQKLQSHYLQSAVTQQSADGQQSVVTAPEEVVDCHILSIGHMLRPHKLACFDMDSTLIEQEVINELAKAAGIGEQVALITESAMRGEIDFDESFAQRIALLESLPITVLDDICTQLTLSKGAQFTIGALKALGYHTVLLSGGFTYFAHYIAQKLGIDEVHANELDIDNDKVTGQVQLPIVNGERKAMLTQKIAGQLGIEMSQVVCVGDGANDLAMMAVADLGVAYHAKPIVQARADAAINVTGLEGVLYALGYPAPKCD